MNESDHFDLLPFIAVLLCILGCLLLVTLSMSAISVGLHAREAWIAPTDPSPSSKDGLPTTIDRDSTEKKLPVLIEWDGEQATVHMGSVKQQVQWREKEKNTNFQDVLTVFKGMRDTHYALFAVRPSGFSTFQQMADQFRAHNIGVGYEPLGQERAVKLVFKKVGNALPAR